MQRYTLLAIVHILTASILGCQSSSGYAVDGGSCVVAYDCGHVSECLVPACNDGECAYSNALDGASCMHDGIRGACVSGECEPLGLFTRTCGAPIVACQVDSDCFVEQCTSSICNSGSCVHIPYEDGATCIGGSSAVDLYFGKCSSCSCVQE
jgi:hypothetical protein